MTNHSSNLAWKIPHTGESGRLPPMVLQRVGHDLVTEQACTYYAGHRNQSWNTIIRIAEVQSILRT